jgi:uncharacterized membrane protein
MQPINPWLSRFAKLLVGATFCLIFLGGMVTSTNAGLSVPDWPTSYGYNMFTFPIDRWVGGILFEHTHRLWASGVGLMTTVLVAWIWRNRWAVPAALAVCAVVTGAVAMTLPHLPGLGGLEEEHTRGLIIMHVNIWSFAAAFVVMLLTTEKDRWRHGQPWLQWLGFGAFLLVCVQGTLGGLRVTEVSTVLDDPCMHGACVPLPDGGDGGGALATLAGGGARDCAGFAGGEGDGVGDGGGDLLPVDDRRGDAAFARGAVDPGFSFGLWPADSADAQ